MSKDSDYRKPALRRRKGKPAHPSASDADRAVKRMVVTRKPIPEVESAKARYYRRRELRFGPHHSTPAKASDFLKPITRLTKKEVVIYVRESSHVQRWRGNLEAQERHLRRELAALGIRVIACFREVGSGWGEDLSGRRAAFASARARGVTVVALSADRLLRSVDYSTTNQSAQPSLGEWTSLMHEAEGVALVTFLDPDMDWKNVRSYQTKVGIVKKNAKGGRPLLNQDVPRDTLFKRAIFQRRFYERSYREIARNLGLSWNTVSRWVSGKD